MKIIRDLSKEEKEKLAEELMVVLQDHGLHRNCREQVCRMVSRLHLYRGTSMAA